MKILIMGAGGVGGTIGGLLARSGEDVTFVARGAHMEAINSNGLRVRSASAGEFTVRAPAVERPDGPTAPDLVIFCVKSYQNEQAVETVKPAVGDETAILTLQNGIGSGDQLAAAFGAERVLLGAVYVEAMLEGPGVVAHLGDRCRVVFGGMDGREALRGSEVLAKLRGAGVDTELSSDVSRALWEKLVFICALSGMTCITRGSFAEVMNTPGSRDLARRVVQEVVDVAAARRVSLGHDMVESTMAQFERSKDDLRSSMHLDLERGRPLELGVLNGAVSDIGKEVAVPTPVNDFIASCLTVADARARAAST
jgi:2-dehydropantoate 2-reductase